MHTSAMQKHNWIQWSEYSMQNYEIRKLIQSVKFPLISANISWNKFYLFPIFAISLSSFLSPLCITMYIQNELILSADGDGAEQGEYKNE